MSRSSLSAAAEASRRAAPLQMGDDPSTAEATQDGSFRRSVSVSIASNTAPSTRWRENMLGVDVEFPYTPYPQQIVLMKKIVECVLQGKHGLLESPTGTGKTLCLLCATLAAQQHQQHHHQLLEPQPQPQGKVIYASRTHAQLQQVVRELRKTTFGGACSDGASSRGSLGSSRSAEEKQKRPLKPERSVPGWSSLQPQSKEAAHTVTYAAKVETQAHSSWRQQSFAANTALKSPARERMGSYTNGTAFRNRARVCLLGSRDHFCVDRSLSHLKGFALNRACKQKIKSQRCIYYAGSQRNKDEVFAKLENEGVFDIEDLHIQAHQAPIFCPYYSMLDYQTRSNLILTPFSNLFDFAGGGGIASEAFSNAAVVVDEAHNIDRVAEDSCGFELRQADLGRCLAALQQAGVLLCQEQPQEQQQARPHVDIEKVYTLTLGLKALDEWMEKLTLSDPQGGFHVPYRLLRLFDFAPKAQSLQRQAEAAAAAVAKGGIHFGAPKGNNCASVPAGFFSLKKPTGETPCPSETRMIDAAEKLPPATESFFGFETREELFNTLDACIEVLLEGSPETDAFKNPLQDEAMKLEELRRCCKVLFSDTTVLNEESFWVYVHQEKIKLDFFDAEDTQDDTQQDNIRTHRTLVFLCMTPAPAFQNLVTKNVRSVLLASGTLSPLLPLARRMSSPSFSVSVMWSNSHIIASSQCRTLVVNSAASTFDLFNKTEAVLSADGEEPLLGTFQNRKSVAYLSALANTICRLSLGIFGGVLVFFPSYALMDSFLEFLKKGSQTSNSGPWNTLLQSSKQIFVEPKKGQALSDMLIAFKRAIDEDLRREGAREGTTLLTGKAQAPGGTAGAVLFGVAKGKIAEGLDLGDWYCRLVIVVGLPYASTSDPRVTLKKMFLDRQRAMALERKDTELPPSGQEWYRQEAMRAVNQAVGRVIRHSDDFGLVALVDSRFTQYPLQADLSTWVRAGLAGGPSVVSATAAGTAAAEFFEKVPLQLMSKALNKIDKVVGVFLNRQLFSWHNVAAAAIAAAGGTSSGFTQSCCSRLQQSEKSCDSLVSHTALLSQKPTQSHVVAGTSSGSKQVIAPASATAIAAAARKAMLLRGTQAVGGPSKKLKKGGTGGALVTLTNAAVGFKPKPSVVPPRNQSSQDVPNGTADVVSKSPAGVQALSKTLPSAVTNVADSALQGSKRNCSTAEVEKAKESGRRLLSQLRLYLGSSYTAFCSILKQIPVSFRTNSGITGKSAQYDAEAAKSLIREMCHLLLGARKITSEEVQCQQDSWIELCEDMKIRAELLHQIIKNYFCYSFDKLLHEFVDGYADDILRSGGAQGNLTGTEHVGGSTGQCSSASTTYIDSRGISHDKKRSVEMHEGNNPTRLLSG